MFSNCTGQFQTAIGTDLAKQVSFGCAKLDVPLDYSQPTSQTTLSIFVVRMHLDRQQSSDRIGSLLVNPGGPGESGINYAASLLSTLDKSVLEHFDLIGFDPRGVGLSAPLDCITGQQQDASTALDADMRTATGRAAARALALKIRQQCHAEYGQTLADYNTEYTARDLDRIRAGLGEQSLNYLGYGYGARLAAVYARLFPGRLRVAALDGPTEAGALSPAATEARTAGIEQAFDRFAADCVTRSGCAVLGDVRAATKALVAGAVKRPIPAGKAGATRAATAGVLLDGIAAGVVDPANWKRLGAALVTARHGDAAGLLALADEFDQRDPQSGKYESNWFDGQIVIGCNDSSQRVTDALVASAAAAWSVKYPLFGNAAAAQLYRCYDWPASGHPVPGVTAAAAPPILVIGTVHSSTAPYAAAGQFAREVGSGVLLTWNGDGQTAYPRTKCVSEIVNEYLITATAATGSCPAE